MRSLLLLALLALAACGADGAPEPKVGKTGVQVGGEIGIGVTGTL